MRVFELIIDGIVIFNLLAVIVGIILLLKRKPNYKQIVIMENFVMWFKSFVVLLLAVIYYVVFNSGSLTVVGYLMISEIIYIGVMMLFLFKDKKRKTGLVLALCGMYLANGILGLLNIIEVV